MLHMSPVIWLNKPEDHDFPAAANYLGLLADPATVSTLIDRLLTKRIGASIAEDLGSLPQIRSGGIQKGPVGWTVWSSEIFPTGELKALAGVAVVVPLLHAAIHRTGGRIGTRRLPRRSRMYLRCRVP